MREHVVRLEGENSRNVGLASCNREKGSGVARADRSGQSEHEETNDADEGVTGDESRAETEAIGEIGGSEDVDGGKNVRGSREEECGFD